MAFLVFKTFLEAFQRFSGFHEYIYWYRQILKPFKSFFQNVTSLLGHQNQSYSSVTAQVILAVKNMFPLLVPLSQHVRQHVPKR